MTLLSTLNLSLPIVNNFLPDQIESLTNESNNFSAISNISARNSVTESGIGQISSEPNIPREEQKSVTADKISESHSQPLSVGSPDLVGRFAEIVLPDTMEMGDRGQVKLIVENRGNAVAVGLITIKLYASTDSLIDANDAVIASVKQTINLEGNHSITLDIDYENNPSIFAPGCYQIIAQIDSENTITEQIESNNLVNAWVSAPGTDKVIDWHSVALDAIQAEALAGRGIPPTSGSRLLAILSNSIHDTVNSFEHTYQPYLVNTNAPRNASEDAAIVGAAYRVLSALIPRQTAFFVEQMKLSLQEMDDEFFKETVGLAFGYGIADKILKARKNDGSQDNTPYTPPLGDYVWHPDPPNFVAVGPNWGKVKPFSTPDLLTRFPVDGLDGRPDTNPELYAREIEQVRVLGGRENTAVTTLQRTPDQTEMAVFWAYDRPDSFRPYGHLNQLAAYIAMDKGNTLAENARMFAVLNTSLADAAIVGWNEKYKTLQPRPDDVIAGGLAANDGIDATIPDPDWVPLLSPTPPFPDYPSGHSSFGGAFAGALKVLYGEDFVFKGVSQELPGVTRTFSLSQAAYEDAISRVYGGVHVLEASVTDSLPIGLAIGQFVAENFFQPVI